MKTVPDTEYLNIESDYISGPQSQENIHRIKPESNQGQNNLNDSESQGYTESESLIICNYELASSFQIVKNDKNKFNPGRYLHKVFLTGVAQKCRSQSLPSCLEKRKCLPNASEKCSTVEESNEQSSPLVKTCEQSFFDSSSSKEQSSETWFKTWPERGVDKLISSKVGSTCKDDTNHVGTENNCMLDMPPNLTNSQCSFVPNCNNCTSSKEHGFSRNISKKCDKTESDTQRHKTLIKQVKETDSEQTYVDQKFNTHKPVPLNDALDSIPLVYSPITKQLHLINKSDCAGIRSCEKNSDSSSGSTNLVEDKILANVNSCKFNTEFDNRPKEESLFSSTVSSLSDNSPSIYEDSAHGSLLDYADTCSLMSFAGCSTLSEESGGEKEKKKIFSGFFSRNVFGWRGGSENKSNSIWNSSSISASFEQYSEENGSLAPDSPCSVRSSSSGVRTFSHENRVASSSALIQLDRPANLPAKNQDEESRHRHEYQEMVEAARKKELKEAKQRKKQMQIQLKTEEQLAHATKVWTREILPKWEQMRNTRKTRELWWQGVPPCVRGKVWRLTITDQLNLTSSLYDICVMRAQDKLKSSEPCDDVDETDNKEASMQLIQLDISRTFPHLCIFQKGGPFYDMLHSLLAAYVCYRPDVGYVQGMSFIAAVLILNMEAADAFVCFANLLNRPCHMAFFRLNEPIMQAYYSTYNDLFKENLPKLFSHFNKTTLSPDLYLLDWIYTIFTKAMNLDLACRVWDLFLRDGEQFIFRTALGILHLCQDTLLKMDFVHGSQFLTRLPDDLSSDQLFKSISAVRMCVGKQSFEDILSFHIQAATSQSS